MTDFRALCAELVDAYAWCIDEYMTAPSDQDSLVQRARTALAQSKRPADEEVVTWLREAAAAAAANGWDHEAQQLTRAADLLEQQQHLLWLSAKEYENLQEQKSPQPISVTERLPEAGDCDAEERCWWWIVDDPGQFPYWICAPVSASGWAGYTHWLPFQSLPIPRSEENLYG